MENTLAAETAIAANENVTSLRAERGNLLLTTLSLKGIATLRSQ